jgi:hypothetical protein
MAFSEGRTSVSGKTHILIQRRKEGHILNLKYSATSLARAFGGKLVPEDTKDEPASVLLERIRAEREKQAELKRKGKIGDGGK